MANSDKRARKKQHRDEVAAAQAAALRRRRAVRIIGFLLVFALVAAFAAAGAGGDDGPRTNTEGSGRGEGAAGAGDDERASVGCGGDDPPEASPQEYPRAPEMSLGDGVDYGAVLDTSCGEIVIDLLEDEAPETVNSFVWLAREGFYDGLTWHRVVDGFVIQTGDPDGRPTREPNGAGYTVPDELPQSGRAYTLGTVAMANSGPGTQSSQFFIVATEEGPPGLDPAYSIFGETAGPSTETLLELAARPTTQSDDPAEADMPKVPVYINSVEITET